MSTHRVHCSLCSGTGIFSCFPCERCDRGYIDKPETMHEHAEALRLAFRDLGNAIIKDWRWWQRFTRRP